MENHELYQCDAARLRVVECEFFLKEYLKHCGQPTHNHLGMASCLDAFVFCIASLEEMASDDQASQLLESDVFRFFKAARNVTAHHSMLTAPVHRGGERRPLIQDYEVHVGGPQVLDSSRFRIDVRRCRDMFETAAHDYPPGARVFRAGMEYLDRIEDEGNSVGIEDAMAEVLRVADRIVPPAPSN